MSTFTCPLCKKTVKETPREHAASEHDSPDRTKRTIAGEEQELTDAEYIEKSVALGDTDKAEGKRAVSLPVQGPLQALGLKLDNVKSANVSAFGGGIVNETEFNAIMEFAEDFVGFKIDRERFIVDLVYWGTVNAWTEEVEGAGGWVWHTAADQIDVKQVVKSAESFQTYIRKRLKDDMAGRSFTLRRLGRYLAPDMPWMFDNNERLRQLKNRGTPTSNRLGIPPSLVLTASSIYDSVKPYTEWSRTERECHTAAIRNVVKFGSQQQGGPRDLRPNPVAAQGEHEAGRSDYHVHHSNLSGETIVGTKRPSAIQAAHHRFGSNLT